MNKSRRAEIQATIDTIEEIKSVLLAAQTDLDGIKDDIEALKSEEQEYFDNMPESFQQGEKGEVAQAAIDEMEEAVSKIEEAIDNLTNAQS